MHDYDSFAYSILYIYHMYICITRSCARKFLMQEIADLKDVKVILNVMIFDFLMLRDFILPFDMNRKFGEDESTSQSTMLRVCFFLAQNRPIPQRGEFLF